jgi:hypothetical protein
MRSAISTLVERMMDELIARLEKAAGPDRELDGEIFLAADARLVPMWPHWTAEQRENLVPRYTTCIDAALTLVSGEPWVKLEWDHMGEHRLFSAWVDPCEQGYCAPTMTLAICIAALKARS